VSRGWAGLAAACAAAALVVAASTPASAARDSSATRAEQDRAPTEAPSSGERVLPPPTSSPPPTTAAAAPMLGFDTCETPTVEEMAVWKSTSPFSAVGVYIGGAARHCPNPALDSPAWVRAVTAQGWRLIPTYVGLQAPCSDFNARMDPATSASQGIQAANDAVMRAQKAGIGTGAPIYFDLEAFDAPDAACLAVVATFISSWTQRLHDYGYVAGLYGNLRSGVMVMACMVDSPGLAVVDALWIAAWSGNWRVEGFDGLLDGLWSGSQRIHQYLGDHDETWGGVTLNIDSNFVNGPVYPMPTRATS
jgi:hypothetical protein